MRSQLLWGKNSGRHLTVACRRSARRWAAASCSWSWPASAESWPALDSDAANAASATEQHAAVSTDDRMLHTNGQRQAAAR